MASYFIDSERYGRPALTPNWGRIIGHGAILVIALSILFGSFGVIDAGERGVKTRLGNVVGIVDPGMYFKWPFIDSVETMNVRTQSVIYERENPLASASSDLQDVSIASVTNYHVQPDKVADLYIQYKTLENFEESVIRPAVRDTVKAVASQYSAADLAAQGGADYVALKAIDKWDGHYPATYMGPSSNIPLIQIK